MINYSSSRPITAQREPVGTRFTILGLAQNRFCCTRGNLRQEEGYKRDRHWHGRKLSHTYTLWIIALDLRPGLLDRTLALDYLDLLSSTLEIVRPSRCCIKYKLT